MTALRSWGLLLIIFIASCAPQPTQEVPAEFKPGQKYFHKTCSNCHGSDAMGKHTKAPKLIDKDYIQEIFSDEEIIQAVIDGTGKMPSQRKKVSDQELAEIIKYLRHSQKVADLVIEEENEEEMLDEGETS